MYKRDVDEISMVSWLMERVLKWAFRRGSSGSFLEGHEKAEVT